MKNLRAKFAHPVFPILFVTILGYGLLLPFTGFYWDDWPFAWIAKFLGPAEFIPAFMPFRPFLGPIFYATTSLIPPIPLYWQIFALIIRFLIGLSVWWTFKQLWATRPRFALTLALLLTVFPGYSQHWVALTHINQELIPFLFYILSFGFTFKALRAERPLTYIIIALLLQLCGVFPTEYFFGLEGLRLLLLFFNSDGVFIARIRGTIKIWMPYFIIWALNALWLAYYYRFGPYNSYEVNAARGFSFINILVEIGDTLWKVCFYIWGQVLFLLSANSFAPSSILTICLIALTFALLAFYIPLLKGENESRTFAMSLIATGLIGILLGRLPSLAAGLPLRLQSSYDRFMISMVFGGSLFIIGFVELLLRSPRHKAVVYSVLIALGVGQQFFNANIFRRDWEQQQNIYWQLSWRIPALKPNTVLLTHQLPIDYETDLSFTAPINWLYAAEINPPSLPYALLYTEKRISGVTLPSLAPNTDISITYRTTKFQGSTSQAVVIYMPANGCLRVLDPSRGDAEIYANLPAVLTDAIPLSNPSLIITSPDVAASPAFHSSEPQHTWCYYYTKAELAHQIGDMEKVMALESEAVNQGYAPKDFNEWLIFIEARALTGDMQTAQKLSQQILKDDPKMRRGVCSVWKRMQAKGAALNVSNGQAGSADKITEILSALNCPQ
ncbi:MAG: hypothetical protein HY864_01175 [Chloroflexi bacterium]|nr:hypothetical protein [Chloroflexota bacterium]